MPLRAVLLASLMLLAGALAGCNGANAPTPTAPPPSQNRSY